MLFLKILAIYTLMALLVTVHINVLPLTPVNIRYIFIISLFVTSIMSLRQLLSTPRIRRLFPRKFSNEELAYIRYQTHRLITKLQGKTKYATYNEARTVRQHVLDWLELAETGFVTPHDTRETRRIIRCYLDCLEDFAEQPKLNLRQTPHIERQLSIQLRGFNRYFHDRRAKSRLNIKDTK